MLLLAFCWILISPGISLAGNVNVWNVCRCMPRSGVLFEIVFLLVLVLKKTETGDIWFVVVLRWPCAVSLTDMTLKSNYQLSNLYGNYVYKLHVSEVFCLKWQCLTHIYAYLLNLFQEMAYLDFIKTPNFKRCSTPRELDTVISRDHIYIYAKRIRLSG